MFLTRPTIALVLSALLLAPSASASRVHRAPTNGKSKTSSSRSAHKTKTSAKSRSHRTTRRRARKVRGQQKIDSERATQIQQALIREHYLSGDPSGDWDSASIAAMKKYQSDHGWQTKLTPDARALKKLGLGPDYSSALNAKEGHFGPPPPESTIPTEQASGFAAAAGVNQ